MSTAFTADRARRVQLRDELLRLHKEAGLVRQIRLSWKLYSWSFAIGGAKLAKRLVDVSTSAAALIALAPLFLLVAALIRRHDQGPILFWQKRVGRWGREFDFPKFRSMRVDAEALKDALITQNDHAKSSLTFKMKRDPRVTPIGRFIRKVSIDELPQLLCVLKGEMSLVGPRPPVPREVASYTLADRRRLDVTPGLTCIWQVSGRGDIPFDRQVALDVQYIQSHSLRFDLMLILKTIPAVLTGRGAY